MYDESRSFTISRSCIMYCKKTDSRSSNTTKKIYPLIINRDRWLITPSSFYYVLYVEHVGDIDKHIWFADGGLQDHHIRDQHTTLSYIPLCCRLAAAMFSLGYSVWNVVFWRWPVYIQNTFLHRIMYFWYLKSWILVTMQCRSLIP